MTATSPFQLEGVNASHLLVDCFSDYVTILRRRSV
jgi:hypothetical protein